jgi:hypothetical protein
LQAKTRSRGIHASRRTSLMPSSISRWSTSLESKTWHSRRKSTTSRLLSVEVSPKSGCNFDQCISSNSNITNNLNEA